MELIVVTGDLLDQQVEAIVNQGKSVLKERTT
jgi:hypothetical protein